MTEEAREAAARAVLGALNAEIEGDAWSGGAVYDSDDLRDVGIDGRVNLLAATGVAFDAGVREGIRRAREAAANVDPIESALSGSDAAVWAIDALEAEK